MTELHSRAKVAEMLGVSERTLRRLLPKVPALACHRIGRAVYFGDADIEMIKRAFRCPYTTANGGKSGTFGERSGSAVKPSRFQNTPQAAARELMLRLSAPRKKPESAGRPLKAPAPKPPASPSQSAS